VGGTARGGQVGPTADWAGIDSAEARRPEPPSLFALLALLSGFSLKGFLVITLWTWGWDLFLRRLFEADGTLPDSVLRIGDVLSRVGAAAHLARIAWRQWGASISAWLASTPAAGQGPARDNPNVAEESPR